MMTSAGQKYKRKTEEQKNRAFQNTWTKFRKCSNPDCGNWFRILLAYWDGKAHIKLNGATKRQAYCCDECKQEARKKRHKERRKSQIKATIYCECCR